MGNLTLHRLAGDQKVLNLAGAFLKHFETLRVSPRLLRREVIKKNPTRRLSS